MDCSWPGSSVSGIFQVRILEWVTSSFSMGSSQPRDWTQVSYMGRWIFYCWATREDHVSHWSRLNHMPLSGKKRQLHTDLHGIGKKAVSPKVRGGCCCFQRWRGEILGCSSSTHQTLSCCCLVTMSCPTVATPWTTACQASLFFISSQSLLRLMSLSWWCHPTISSSVAPFSSCPQSFPASGSFPVSQMFASGGQSIGASASTSVLPMDIPGLISFRMDWFDLLAVQGTLKSLLQHHSSKSSIPMIPSGSLDPLSALLESLLSLMVLLSSRLASDDPRKLSGNTVNSNFRNGKPQLTP